MGDPHGFLKIQRAKTALRPVDERLLDYRELDPLPDEASLRDQASRCMDCGVPFCHRGCPLGNLIPEWNDHVTRARWDDAVHALEATNNFPEVTGRVCPAPCEASCVLNLQGIPVTIKEVERSIAARLDPELPLAARPAPARLGRRVAVVGSGPAGLAAAQQLARKGYDVTVFERDDRIGGLLRYGIPDFKLEKNLLDRRTDQLRREGVVFRTGVDVGTDLPADALQRDFDAAVLCIGALQPRELPVPGRELGGVHRAMAFLTQQNRRVAGDDLPDTGAIVATGKRVVILGGGDTGADCLGTSHRQGAAQVTQIELMPRPPVERLPHNPWPEWPLVLRTSSSHEEGGERDFAVLTKRLLGDDHGHVRALEAVRIRLEGGRIEEIPGSAFEIPCELVLLAMGFIGPERSPLLDTLGVALDPRGNVVSRDGATSVPGVFVAGDASRGASLVVWAIAEGRRAAEAVHAHLVRSPAVLRLAVP
ncbi:glutamate synthase subunit beta [Chondromyces crocatus]|uniref:Dihydropyrimidine dehydrogenase subunit A n=1 Tax=Chondromyces crocatus TaxID=52 RepID=A0A0K1ERZ9_CHOCO|nr:glutamate synthase subunit beta [Chondromyces crocatus]AKT43631.1 dihydropyrimidine dehydrogenase subunit A [Chondromyces crocatus]